MSNYKYKFSSLKEEHLYKDRKAALEKMLTAKRTRLINEAILTSTKANGIDSASTHIEQTIHLETKLFEELDQCQGKLTKNLFDVFEKIRVVISLNDQVPFPILETLITPKFLKMAKDFISYGDYIESEHELYGRILKELFWIIINLFTTPQESHEDSIMESKLLDQLIECFSIAEDQEISLDILQAFDNFLKGSDHCKTYMINAGLYKALCERMTRIIESNANTDPQWTYYFFDVSLLLVSRGTIIPPKDASQILSLISATFQNSGNFLKCNLGRILNQLQYYISMLSPFDIQTLIHLGFDRGFLSLFKSLGKENQKEDQEKIISILNRMLKGIDCNQIIEVSVLDL